MTDISKISNGTNTYNIKDATARTGLSGKQDTLVSGTNIKTVGGMSLLGSGDISIPTVDLTYSGSSHNAQSGVAVAMAIDSAISSVYKPGGSVAFTSLPAPGSTNEGYVYNVTDAFITTSNFVEGEGKSYPAGTNVVIIPEDIIYYSWGELLTLSSTPQVGDATYKDYSYGSGEPLIQVYGSVDSVGANYAYIEELDETYYRTSNNDINSSIYKFDVLTGTFQPLLISGTNIKTINNTSILGSGNIALPSVEEFTATEVQTIWDSVNG